MTRCLKRLRHESRQAPKHCKLLATILAVIGALGYIAAYRNRLVVKRQQVVSIGARARHGCESSDALVWAMPVVVMGPSPEHGSALGGTAVRDAIGPFPQCRLNEALSLAVRLRPVWQPRTPWTETPSGYRSTHGEW